MRGALAAAENSGRAGGGALETGSGAGHHADARNGAGGGARRRNRCLATTPDAGFRSDGPPPKRRRSRPAAAIGQGYWSLSHVGERRVISTGHAHEVTGPGERVSRRRTGRHQSSEPFPRAGFIIARDQVHGNTQASKGRSASRNSPTAVFVARGATNP